MPVDESHTDTVASSLQRNLGDANLPTNSLPSTSSTSIINDIASTTSSVPCQPLIHFPVSYFSGKARSFNSDWYKQYSWLEYSVQKDAAFCFPCRLFFSPSIGHSRPEKSFTEIGFRDWKHATGTTGVLSKHANCKTHKLSVIAWQQYLAAEKHQSVAEQLGSNRAEQIKKNRHYIASIIEVLLLCSKQEIAFRGHDECDTSLNRGNFREILGLVAGHDSVVEEWLSHGPRNAKYTSPTIQNNILSIMATLVRRSICSAVQKTGYYSIMVDETKDLSKQEQLSIAVRYIDVDKIAVMERFLTFFPAKALNAESLTQYILDTLTLYNLDPQMIVSQGYDGASVMSGSCSGVQKRIREVAPCASYIHCHAHVLNLVLVDCAKNNQHAAEFFSLIQALYVIVSTSKGHALFIEKQKELHPNKQVKELQSLSDTRWASRSLALNAISSTFDSLIETLECLAEDNDKAKAVEAIGLLHQVHSFKFVATLIIFDRIFSITKSLSDQLQAKNLDFSSATSLILSTTKTLQELRTDNIWDRTYKYIKSVSNLHGIDEFFENTRRRRTPSRRIQDSTLLESVGYRNPNSCSDSMKINVYFPVLDHMLFELERRFSSKNLDLMRAVDACSPSSDNFLDSSLLSSFASLYGICSDRVENECLLAKPVLNEKEVETVLDVFTHLLPLQAAFPTIVKLFQIAMTLVVSTAQCERSFSTLRRIKTHLRTTMSNERLTDISLLSLERDLCSVERVPNFIQDTIKEFEGIDKNRTIRLS